MAKVNIHFPSKMFRYGVLEFEFEVPDDSSPSELGTLYARRVLEFQAAESIAVEAAKSAETAPAIAAAERVAKPAEAAPAPAPAVVTPPISAEQSAAQLIESELGGKVVAEETAPWDEDAPPKAEPWKNNSTIEDLFA